MKKNTLIYLLILIIITVLISAFFLFGGKNEIKDQTEIARIIEDSNLEIIHNLSDFNTSNYSTSKLLEVSMLLAEKKGYMNESDSGDFLEYVSQSDIHSLIRDLTNISIEAPIQIEDFNYRYDSENEYYYKIPLETSTYKISSINHVYEKDNIYTIEAISIKTEDGEIIAEDTITTKLEYIKTNTYTTYQVIDQKISTQK